MTRRHPHRYVDTLTDMSRVPQVFVVINRISLFVLGVLLSIQREAHHQWNTTPHTLFISDQTRPGGANQPTSSFSEPELTLYHRTTGAQQRFRHLPLWNHKPAKSQPQPISPYFNRLRASSRFKVVCLIRLWCIHFFVP